MWMLVEMDISQELPNKMFIEETDGTYREQWLGYEWKPHFCEGYFQIGQHTENCAKAPHVIQKQQPHEDRGNLVKKDTQQRQGKAMRQQHRK